MPAPLVKLARFFLYAVIFTPFFLYRYTIYPFITLHTFFFETVILVAFVLFLALAALEPKFRPLLTPLFVAGAVFVGVLLVASIASENPPRSFWSNPERTLGSIAYLFFFAYYFIFASFLRAGEINLKKYLTTEFIVSAVVALIGLWQYFKPTLFFGLDLSERVGSVWGNPTYLAVYLIFNIFIALWLLKEKNFRSYWLWFGIVLETVMIFITQTRGEILGLAAAFFIVLAYFALKYKGEGRAAIRRASAAILVFLVLLTGIFLATRNASLWRQIPGFNRLAHLSLNEFYNSDRYLVWQTAWKAFKDKPILGYGPENFIVPFSIHYNPEALKFGKGSIFDRPHNIFLEYLSTSGILGLLAYLGLIGAAFYSLRKKPLAVFFAAALVAYLLQAALTFDVLASLTMLFMFFAVIDYYYRPHPSAAVFKIKEGAANFLLPILGVAAAAVFYLIIWLPLSRNYNTFWAEVFVNRKDFTSAFIFFDKALRGKFNLYADYIRLDRAAAVNITLRSGLVSLLPSPAENIRTAMDGINLAMSHHPQDVSFKIVGINLANSALAVTQDKSYADQARAIVAAALALNPYKQEVYYGLIETEMLTGNYKEAEALVAKVINLTKEDYAVDAHYLLGITLFAEGKPQEGAAEVHKAIERGYVFPSFTQARLTADRIGDAGYYDDAILLYRRALQLNPADWESAVKIGIVYYLKGEMEAAADQLESVVKLNPDIKKLPGIEQYLPIFAELGVRTQ